jgi:hypothetical protein
LFLVILSIQLAISAFIPFPVSATSICEQTVEERWGTLILPQFTIDADSPIKVNDVVKYSFKIKNRDITPVELASKKGIYLRAKIGDYSSIYSHYEGLTIPPV